MDEIVIATNHLDRVLACSQSQITVQAGVPLYALQTEIARSGAVLPARSNV